MTTTTKHLPTALLHLTRAHESVVQAVDALDHARLTDEVPTTVYERAWELERDTSRLLAELRGYLTR